MEKSTSFPQNIFHQLQGVQDIHRTPYLSKAVGTNGLKVAALIVSDTSRESMKEMVAQILHEESCDDIECSYLHSDDMLAYSGNLSTAEGRGRYTKIVKMLASDGNINSPCVTINIIKNSVDISFKEKYLVDYHTQKIIQTLKRRKNEE